MSKHFNYKEFLQKPSIKSKYNSMLEFINNTLNNPNITHRPLTYRYEYWLYTINKNNKVYCNNWVDGKRRSINRELKMLCK
jgi:hypothetical protein